MSSADQQFAKQLDEALGLSWGVGDTCGAVRADPPNPLHGERVSVQPSLCGSPAHLSSSETSCALHASPGPYDYHAADSAGPYSPVLPPSPGLVDDTPEAAADAPAPLNPSDHQQAVGFPAAAPRASKRARSRSPQHITRLPQLPREVLLRVLYFVSAEDLAALAQTCSLLQQFSDEPVLWRRLYCARWGNRGLPRTHHSWKVRYRERDTAELRDMLSSAPEGMEGVWRDMAVAKRQTALGRQQVEDLFLVPDEVGELVRAWRRAHGFETGGPTAGSSSAHTVTARNRAPGSGGGSSSRGQGVGRVGAGAPTHRLVPPAGGGGGGGCAGGGSAAAEASRDAPTAAAAAARAVEPGQAGNAQQHQHQQQQQGAPGQVTHGSSSGGGGGSSSSRHPPGGLHGNPPGGSNSSSSRRVVLPAGCSRPQVHHDQRQQRQRQQLVSTFERVTANIWCCTVTGRVHVCDEGCGEKVVDRSTGLLVCPISGATSDRILSLAEEELEEGAAARGVEEGGGPAAEEDFGGRLARAFTAGYYADDEQDLLRTCGVRFRR